MRLKTKLMMSLLGGAMLALPLTAPAFAEPSFNTDSNYVQKVDWHHHDRDWDDYGYRHRPYWNRPYYGGYRYGYGRRYGYGYGRRWGNGPCWRARELSEQARRDSWSGHPGAAGDVANMAAEARARCYNR